MGLAMSRRRRVPYRFTEKGQCRWCGKPPKSPRRTWCSQECVDAYLIRSDPGFARRKVFDRDSGICAVCGLDCVALRSTLREMMKDLKRQFYHDPEPGRYQRLFHEFREGLERYGLWRFLFRSAWEADHILPVTEGGGECGLDNYRTLCWRCHANETAALAARRADARRVGRSNILDDGMNQQQ